MLSPLVLRAVPDLLNRKAAKYFLIAHKHARRHFYGRYTSVFRQKKKRG